MRPRARQKLDQIFSYSFFESVGKAVPDSVIHIATWKMAAKECSKLKWSNCQLMARNAIQTRIEKQYPKPGMWERLQEWNPLAEETAPLINSFVDSLLPRILLPDKSKEKIKHHLRYYIFYACLECEFIDISEPVFFIKHLDPWFAAGHFPCGWSGKEFPTAWDGALCQGKFMVF
jgi:hypothetical protein